MANAGLPRLRSANCNLVTRDVPAMLRLAAPDRDRRDALGSTVDSRASRFKELVVGSEHIDVTSPSAEAGCKC